MDANTIGMMKMLQGGKDTLGAQANLINQPTAEEVRAQGLMDAANQLPQTGLATGLVQGLATGYGVGTKSNAQSKRDKQTAALMEQLKYQQALNDHADEIQAEMAQVQLAQQQKQAMADSFDLALDTAERTGDGSMLVDTLNNEGASAIKARLAKTLPNGAVFQGVEITRSGDLLPVGITPDGNRVYGEASPITKQYSQPYMAKRNAERMAEMKNKAEMVKAYRDAGATSMPADMVPQGMGFAQIDAAPQQAPQSMVGNGTPQAGPQNAPQTVQLPAKQEKGRALSATALKLQNDALQGLAQFSGVNADVDSLIKMIDSGDLNTSLLGRGEAALRNTFNMSDTQSRNLSTLDSKLQSMRNAILLLNKGVQTEGDAQRAMDEIINNKNDTALVRQRLQDLKVLNQRAADLQGYQVEQIRNDVNAPQIDLSKYREQPSSVGTVNAPTQTPVLDSQQAKQIKAAYQAGQMTKEQAKAALRQIGGQ